jgi:hypothetical protein
MATKRACPTMCAAAGFHTDDHRGQLRDTRQQRLPRQAFSEDDVASVIHPHQVKNPLCKVHPSYAKLLFHRTDLLLCGRIAPNPAIMLAHRSRSAKAGQFYDNRAMRGPWRLEWLTHSVPQSLVL